MKRNITGIILAGGKSTRMGKDKALIKIDGKTLIENTLEKIKDYCIKVIISANNSESYSFLNHEIIVDEQPGLGPLGGIYSCLKHSKAEKNLVMAVDIPFINKGFIENLLKHMEDGDIVVPVNENKKIEPLCAIYSKSVIPYVEKMINSNDLKVQNLSGYVKTKFVEITTDQEFYHAGLFQNLNSLSDLNNLLI